MRKKTTKSSLLTSTLALLLCFAMLLGATYAWFTDSVTSSGNKIVSGSLKVDLELLDKDTNEWNSIKENQDPLFSYEKWEPGFTDVKVLKVENEGSLALKWKAVFMAEEELSELANVIDVYVLPYGVLPEELAALTVGYPTSRSLTGYQRVGTLAEFVETISATTYGSLKAEESAYLGIALKMQENAGNDYQKMELGEFDIRIVATQEMDETDSFGNDYDSEALFPELQLPGGITVDVPTDANGKVTAETMISKDTDTVSAIVPAGVQLENGVKKLTLTVEEMTTTGTNITLGENEKMRSLDVHIAGVSKNNTVAITVKIPTAMTKGLNLGNYTLIHVENGVENTMIGVSSLEELDTHNEFYYDPATGDVYLAMATFSEVAVVAEPAKWEGERDYSWYDASKTELTIANADQLAGLSAIVGGMAKVDGEGKIYTSESVDGATVVRDSFAGKTIKLLANIRIGDTTENYADPSENGIIFYPIGYWNSEEKYERYDDVEKRTALESGFYTFEGTFDGNGHTISDWYQNTWEMKGDHNWYNNKTEQYYRDGMGLFGRVYKGTVKNLTVKNFSSDGEITTTGSIAAYADGATFENIAIFNCNPRVYNIGNGGIVGCVGWYAKEANLKTTFKNITVDNTNKISALWGSWDVACGGILGQYYPTSGQSSADYPINGGIDMINCHVAAQIDVYNDVCANYQYYAYRYAGMLIGSVKENVTVDGHVYPKMDGITFTDCKVHFGDWNDYYYCELVANSLASYTHDHQMSRLEQVASIDVAAMTVVTLDGNTKAIPTNGAANYVVVKAKDANGNWVHGDGARGEYATCYHFVNGAVWNHEDAGTEIVDGVEVLKEDKQVIYREFWNLVTGDGWGATSKWVENTDGVTILDREEAGSVDKFIGTNIPEIESYTEIKLSELFNFVNNGVELKLDGLNVTVTDLDDTDGIATGTFKKGETWEDSTITVNGKGRIAITIQDYYFCVPTTIELTAIDPMISMTIDATTLYSVGQELNINSITVNYRSGATKVLSAAEYILSTYDMSFAGKKTIAVNYTEYDHSIVDTFTVTVSDEFNSLTVVPDKDIYNVGDTVKFTVYAVASDGTRAEVTGATLTGADTTVAGIKTVTVTFGNKSATYDIKVLKNTSLDGATDQQDAHSLYWYYNHQFMLGGVASSSTNNYNDYLDKTYTGTNGEIAIGFNNAFAGVYANAASPNGGNALIRGGAQYGLNITNALPYTYVGIRCIAGFDANLIGFGYYVDGNTSTLKYSAPVYYSEKVLTDPNYQQFLDLGGQYTAEANTTVCLGDLGFAAGSSHTITWVAVFEDGYQTLADWTIQMKSSFASNEFFKDTEKPNVNVIVLSGQSNAAGVSPITFDMQVKYNSVNYKHVFMQYKNVGFDNNGVKYTMSENTAFETYYYGMGGSDARFFGPDAALAYYLATTPGLQDEQWFIIKYTAPGTGLELHWLNNNMLADEMMAYVESCLGDLTDQYDVQIRSLLWMQGENDALVEDIAGRYAANEQALVSAFRNKFAKYATLPNDQIPGSGISFISAGIAPAGKDGNTWEFATAVNNAKRDNAYIWYAPGSIGEQSALFDYISHFADNGAGGKSGSIINPNATYGIYNSVYIDTSLMSAKDDDPSHYDAQSMEWLGTWFAQFVEHMMTAELPTPPAPTGNVITFNANGGSCDTSTMTVMPDEAVTLPVPTHEHLSFLCWFDGTNMYWPGDTPTFANNVTLKALWAANVTLSTDSANGITVTLDNNRTAAIAGLETVTITFTNTKNQQRTIYVTVTDSTGATLIARKAITLAANGTTTETFVPQNGNVTVVVEAETYTITYPTSATNSITTTVDKTSAASDETVTITFKNSSYFSNKTVNVTVTDKNGNQLLSTSVTVNRNSTTTKNFQVQNSNVTITVS